MAAVGELLRFALIVAGVILGLGAAGLVALIAYRVRRDASSRTIRARVVPPIPPARPAQPLPPARPAIERPPEVHLHLHGVSAADVAAILARHQDEPQNFASEV